MFYLGGSAPKANIEVHDVQFVAANDVTQAYPILMDRWFGEPSSLHIDAYATVSWAETSTAAAQTAAKLQPVVSPKSAFRTEVTTSATATEYWITRK